MRKRKRSRQDKVWSRSDKAFLRKNYPYRGANWTAKKLHRSVYGARYKASSLGIRCRVHFRNFGSKNRPARPAVSAPAAKSVWAALAAYLDRQPALARLFLDLVLGARYELSEFLQQLVKLHPEVIHDGHEQDLALALRTFAAFKARFSEPDSPDAGPAVKKRQTRRKSRKPVPSRIRKPNKKKRPARRSRRKAAPKDKSGSVSSQVRGVLRSKSGAKRLMVETGSAAQLVKKLVREGIRVTVANLIYILRTSYGLGFREVAGAQTAPRQPKRTATLKRRRKRRPSARTSPAKKTERVSKRRQFLGDAKSAREKLLAAGSVVALAKQIGCNSSNLGTLLKQENGFTASEVLGKKEKPAPLKQGKRGKQSKVEKYLGNAESAKTLLLAAGSVEALAEEIGCNATYLSTTYRRLYQVTARSVLKGQSSAAAKPAKTPRGGKPEPPAPPPDQPINESLAFLKLPSNRRKGLLKLAGQLKAGDLGELVAKLERKQPIEAAKLCKEAGVIDVGTTDDMRQLIAELKK